MAQGALSLHTAVIRSQKMQTTFSKREAFKFGWETFKKHAALLIGVTVLMCAVQIFLSSIAGESRGVVSFLLNIISIAVSVVMGIGFIRILLSIVGGQLADWRMLFSSANGPLLGRYIGMSILSMIVVGVGFILLVIPGIIASIALCFAAYIVIEQGSGPVEALKESAALTKGHRWNLFLFGILAGLLNVAGAILFGIGLVVTIPVTALAATYIYTKFRDASVPGPVMSAVPEIAPVV
jgi:uncharacterized membrane protein